MDGAKKQAAETSINQIQNIRLELVKMYHSFFEKSCKDAMDKASGDVEKKAISDYIEKNFAQFKFLRLEHEKSQLSYEENIVAAIFDGIDIFDPKDPYQESTLELLGAVKDQISQYENIFISLKIAGAEYRDIADNLRRTGLQFLTTAQAMHDGLTQNSASKNEGGAATSVAPKPSAKASSGALTKKPTTEQEKRKNVLPHAKTRSKRIKEISDYSFAKTQEIFLQFLHDFFDKNVASIKDKKFPNMLQIIEAEIKEYGTPQGQERHEASAPEYEENIVEKIFLSKERKTSKDHPLFKTSGGEITTFYYKDLLRDIKKEIDAPDGVFALLRQAKIDLELISAIFCESGQDFSNIACTLKTELLPLQKDGEINCLDAIGAIRKNCNLCNESQRKRIMSLTQEKMEKLKPEAERDDLLHNKDPETFDMPANDMLTSGDLIEFNSEQLQQELQQFLTPPR